MDKHGIGARLEDAFARLNERMDSAEERLSSHQWRGLVVLGGELAQARAMLDILATRLSAIPAGERGDLEQQLAPLRTRWDRANEEYQAAKTAGGKARGERERKSRAALAEVQDGLLQLVAEMNRRFAGRASEIADENARDPG